MQGEKGLYRLIWTANPPPSIPALRIELDDRVILEQNLQAYAEKLSAKYPPGQSLPSRVEAEDMSLQLETPEVTVLLVFSDVEIYVDPRQDMINYWFNLSALYLQEKP